MVQTNGIALNVADGGCGPAIFFLHGFPDHWGTWRRVMARLVNTNRVIAPDLRGYGRSTRPARVQDYAPELLVADVLGLLDKLELSDVTLIGHDWGASLAFWAAMKDCRRIRRLVIINGVHPYLFQDRIWDDPDQRRASQYIKTLCSKQAEHKFTARNAHGIAQEWLAPALKDGKISQFEFDEYLNLWSETSAWPAMINWYRASPISVPELNAPAPKKRWTKTMDYCVPCPVHVIWGDQDSLFTYRLVEDLECHVKNLHVDRIADAGHSPHRDAPEACAKIIRAAMSG
jgi:pimeloyl-ACP methyl ester carboxylesterase